MIDVLHLTDPGSDSCAAAGRRVDDPPLGVDPDAGLVAQARRDPARFLALYDRHFARIHRYARLRLDEPAKAEDVTSEVFLTALAKLVEFRGRGSFAAWLFRIAQNAVRSAHRTGPLTLHCEVLELPDKGPGPEEQALSAERAEALRRLLASLKPEHRDLIALRYGAGLSYQEIGDLVGLSAGAARVAVHRILTDLRGRYDHD